MAVCQPETKEEAGNKKEEIEGKGTKLPLLAEVHRDDGGQPGNHFISMPLKSTSSIPFSLSSRFISRFFQNSGTSSPLRVV